MKNILIVSYLFPPYGGGSTTRIQNFCKYMGEYGWLPHVLTVSDEYYEDIYHQPELLKQLEGKIKLWRSWSLEPRSKHLRDAVFNVRKRTLRDQILLGIAKPLVNGLLIPDRNVLWLPGALLAGAKILRSQSIHAIFSTAPPFTNHLVALLLAQLFRKPLFLDYRDDWVGNPYYVRYKGMHAKVHHMLETIIVRNSSAIFCATEQSRHLLRTKYPFLSPDSVLHLPNGYDPELFGNPTKTPTPSKNGILKLLYIGSLNAQRSPEPLFTAFDILRRQHPEIFCSIEMKFIGYTPSQFIDLAKQKQLGNVSFYKNLSHREVPAALQSCDVAVSIQNDEVGGKTAVPGKLYEYLAMGRPILNITEPGATWTFLADLGNPYNVSYRDADGIFKMLVRISEDQKSGTLDKTLDYTRVRRYNRKTITGELCSFLESLS